MYTYRDDNQNEVTIFLAQQPGAADDCLIIPSYQGKFLFTHHRTRGIEFPGGKSEAGETTLEAAKRELWEETGAELKEFFFVADYQVVGMSRTFTKRVYCGEVAELHKLRSYQETAGPVLLAGELTKMIQAPRFSFFMRDEGMQIITRTALEILREKGFRM